MGLLPDANFSSVSEWLDSPERLDEQLLTRFDTYAPLIRKITVAPGGGEKQAWFLVKIRRRGPLLPGLHTLHLDVKRRGVRYEPALDVFICAMALLCPSLVEIGGPPHCTEWTHSSFLSLLLQLIPQAAPDLKRLRLLVRSQKHIPYIKSSLFSNLGALRNLCTLECTTAMLDSLVLSNLSILSELESLKIDAPAANEPNSGRDNGEPEEDLSLEELTLSPHSFPKLRHLSTQFLPCRVVSQLWGSAPLVQKLISVHVRFHPDDSKPSYSLINDTMRDICKGSPNIVDLSLDSNDAGDHPILSPAVVDYWQYLPLRRLQLLDVYLPESFYEISPFISGMSNMEYLEMESMRVVFDDLVLIACHLPKLRFLVANVTLTGWPDDLEDYSVTPSLSTLRLGSEFVFSKQVEGFNLDEGESMEDYIDLMAEHLHVLWPSGIICEEESTWYIREPSDTEYLNLLRSKLRALNPPGFALPARESYQAEWLYSKT
ncbi:hypothetical protein FRC12_004099 [Ceratobasidium sp. 428]|nr:hypothetical protein FRC12_004099 [Ceratobasidium sp. 428]